MAARDKFAERGQINTDLKTADADIMGIFDKMAKAKMIPISSITIDQSLQVRVDGLKEETVQDYMNAIGNGVKLPEIVVYDLPDGSRLLSSGFHRLEAHRRLGLIEIAAEVRQGTRREAVDFALQDNLHHGLPLTNRDKKAFLIARMLDKSWDGISNRELAKQIGVSHMTVGNWIDEYNITTGKNFPVERAKVTGADGRSYDTNQIKEANRARAKNIFTGLTLTGTKTFEVPERYWALAATCRMVGKFELAQSGDLICYRVPPVAMGWGAVTPEIVKSTVGLETAIKAYRQMMLEAQDDEPPAAPVEPMPLSPNEQKRQLAYLNERLEKLDIRLHNARVANDTRRVDELEEHRRNILEHYARVEAVTFPDKPTPPAEDTSSHEIVLRLIADMETCLGEMGNRLFADWQTYGEKEVSQFRQAFKAHLNGCLEIQLKMKEWWGVY